MSDVGTIVPSRTIAIVSSQHLVGLGLEKIFESKKTVRIVVQLHLRMTAAALLAERPPDVFILDMETAQDAVGAIRQIRESAPKSKIVLLCGLEGSGRTRKAFGCGVDGVILKIQPPAVVLAAIEALYSDADNQAAAKRHHVVDGAMRTTAPQDVDPHAQPFVWPDGLTERQREIIKLVGQGLSNKDVADRLCISESTVRHHLTGIFDKVGGPNRQKLMIHTHHVRSSPV
ncbi:MAG: response regulator transcription factor [Nitrospira sp.]|nr:response regulator transcription factor [Nitrospira sp.]